MITADDLDDGWTNGDTFGDDAFIPTDGGDARDDLGDDMSPVPLFDDASGDDDDGAEFANTDDTSAYIQPAQGDLKLIENVRQVQKVSLLK